MFWAVGLHQCSAANQNKTTQFHTILTPTGPFNLISLSCLTTPTMCAQAHIHAHTPAFTHLEWCRPHEQFFHGGVYTYVVITLLLQFTTTENHRKWTNKHHTLHTACAPTQVQNTGIPLNRALRQIRVEYADQSRSEHCSYKWSQRDVRLGLINYICARQIPKRRHQNPN